MEFQTVILNYNKVRESRCWKNAQSLARLSGGILQAERSKELSSCAQIRMVQSYLQSNGELGEGFGWN